MKNKKDLFNPMYRTAAEVLERANYPDVYIAGRLSNLSPERHALLCKRYENRGLLCREFGLTVHLPHLITDPVRDKGVPATTVFALDAALVVNAGLVLADHSQASNGVGTEMGIAWVVSAAALIVVHDGDHPDPGAGRLVDGNSIKIDKFVVKSWKEEEVLLRSFLEKNLEAIKKRTLFNISDLEPDHAKARRQIRQALPTLLHYAAKPKP